MSRAGWPIHAVASRDAGRRERFTGLVNGARAFVEPQALVEEVKLIILAEATSAVKWYPLALNKSTCRIIASRSVVSSSAYHSGELETSPPSQ